jgi:hypothetical protein
MAELTAESGHGWRQRPPSFSEHTSRRPGRLCLSCGNVLTAPNRHSGARGAVEPLDSRCARGGPLTMPESGRERARLALAAVLVLGAHIRAARRTNYT